MAGVLVEDPPLRPNHALPVFTAPTNTFALSRVENRLAEGFGEFSGDLSVV
jgi:hypothetical protein